MSEKPKKSAKDSLLREVQPKNKKFGLSVPRVKYPHDDYPKLVVVGPQEEADSLKHTSTTDTTGITGITGITDTSKTNPSFQPPQIELQPTSPVRDFTKIPNSVNRFAMAQGLFRGKSKQIYDYLWQISRGAIKPSRTVRCTHGEIKKGAGIGSRNTIIDGLKHLAAVGLVKFISSVGVNEGNEYEIFTPEEIGYTGYPGITDTTGITGYTGISQNLVIPIQPDFGTTGTFQTLENQSISAEAKTLYKTNKEKTDDERLRAAFGELLLILDKTVKDLTGRETTPTDKERWKHVAEILAAQLELIASRTTISNAPAILAEHLHRHLNNKRVQEKMGLLTPAEAREAKEEKESEKPKEIIPDLYLCPDCYGTSFWNPDGRGKRRGCPHPRLEEARQRAAREEME